MKFTLKQAAAAAVALGLLAGGAVVAQDAFVTDPAQVRSGAYELDPSHGKITWSVSHMGFSTYYGQFVDVQGELVLDAANPANSTLNVTVPLTAGGSNDAQLDAHLQTPDFFDTANHPAATFTATSIRVDADDARRAEITGDLTLRGVTRPVTIDARFNQAGEVFGAYVVGFDGEATVRRSEFGIEYGLPMLGDEVTLHLEGEFKLQS